MSASLSLLGGNLTLINLLFNSYSMSVLDRRWQIANEAHSAKLAITSPISNKRKWNNCFIKFRNTLWSDIHTGSSQKTFLAFSRISKHRHWSKLSTERFFFFFFFGFIERKISLSSKNIFSLATIIYHLRSN